MSLTGNLLIQGLGRYLGQPAYYWSSSTTAAGSATSLVDTALARWDDDALIDRFFRITEATHGAIYENRVASDFVGSTGTVTLAPAFGATTGSGTDYEMYRFDPAQMFLALDAAAIEAYPALGRLIYDDTLTGDGYTSTFDIPSTIRRGPAYVLVETPLSAVSLAWNFITNPLGDSTTGWTASSVTASTVSSLDADREIPKYDSTCTKLVVAASTAGTYSQAVADMANSMTAALAAGRRMTFAAWVYCRVASKIRLQLLDDTTTTSGSYHGGGGWELLTVEKTVIGSNATTLTARFDIANDASALTAYWNRAWLYYGNAERVVDVYSRSKQYRIRRDDTTQQFSVDIVPQRGYQLRLIGRDTLSALGTTASTQATNTMELDAESAPLLYGVAAEILLRQQGLAVDAVPGLAAKLAFIKPRLEQMKRQWSYGAPVARLKSPWVR